jgi:hypothetical protein
LSERSLLNLETGHFDRLFRNPDSISELHMRKSGRSDREIDDRNLMVWKATADAVPFGRLAAVKGRLGISLFSIVLPDCQLIFTTAIMMPVLQTV